MSSSSAERGRRPEAHGAGLWVTIDVVRVAYITDTYLPETNGIVTAIVRHSRGLAARGHEVCVFCPRYDGDVGDADSAAPGIRIVRFRSRSAASNPETRVSLPWFPYLTRRLKQFGPDLVHAHTPLPIGVSGVLAARRLGVPLVQTYHSYVPGFLQYAGLTRLLGLDRKPRRVRDSAFAWWLTRLLYNRSDLVLAPSRTLCDVLVDRGITAPVRHQDNGIDLAEFPPRSDWILQRRVMHCGRLGYEKSAEVVVDAFALFAQTRPGWELHLLGEGPAEEHLRARIEQAGIGERVRFDGFVDRARLAEAYRDADVYATASTIETQGIVVLESMASGTPVVGVDALAVPEMARNGRNGIIVAPNDAAAMAEAFARLADDDALREQLGHACIEDVRAHDLSGALDGLERTYRELTDARA